MTGHLDRRKVPHAGRRRSAEPRATPTTALDPVRRIPITRTGVRATRAAPQVYPDRRGQPRLGRYPPLGHRPTRRGRRQQQPYVRVRRCLNPAKCSRSRLRLQRKIENWSQRCVNTSCNRVRSTWWQRTTRDMFTVVLTPTRRTRPPSARQRRGGSAGGGVAGYPNVTLTPKRSVASP